MCVRVFDDKKGGIVLAGSLLGSARSEQVDVSFHSARELLRAKQVAIQFVASEEQHADILTKSLAATPSKPHRRFLMNMPSEGE